MIQYSWADAEGFVVRAGSGFTLPDGAIELPEGLTAMASVHHMLVGGAFVPRPVLPNPVINRLDAGVLVQFTDLPTGTMAEVIDAAIGCTLGSEPEAKGAILIELPEPGLYLIEVTPPRPFLPLSVKIEVNP